MKNIIAICFCLMMGTLSAQVPTTGLISQWSFSGNANDMVGANNSTTVNATLTSDRFGNPNCAYNFNGTSNYIKMLNAGPTGTVSRSVSFWAKSTNTTLTAAFAYGAAPGALAIQYYYGCAGVGCDNGVAQFIRTNTLVANGSWHHYAMIYDNTIGTQIGNIQLYVDGVLATATGCGTTTSPINTNSVFPINIGKVADNNIRYFKGDLDDFFLYNRALTPTEVLALYNDVSCVGTPVAPTAVNGNAAVCAGSTVVYSVNPVPGATSYTWTLPGGWTGTSTSNTISAIVGSSSGQIVVAAKNCCGSSQPVTLDVNVSVCAGISEINNNDLGISIFPNPNSGNFNLKGELNEITELKIFNAIGQEVYSKTIEKHNKEIRTKLSDGTYLVRFYKEKTLRSTQRLVIVNE